MSNWKWLTPEVVQSFCVGIITIISAIGWAGSFIKQHKEKQKKDTQSVSKTIEKQCLIDENDTDFADSTKTGGEKVHTLTISEMPAHAHSLSSPNGTLYADINSTTYITMSASGSTWMTNRGQISMGNNGGGQSHNNLPPFQAAYCWKRIS